LAAQKYETEKLCGLEDQTRTGGDCPKFTVVSMGSRSWCPTLVHESQYPDPGCANRKRLTALMRSSTSDATKITELAANTA
jgi:hypothetical protein